MLSYSDGVLFVVFSSKRSTEDSVPVFLAKPSVVVFTDYSVGHVYEVSFIDHIITLHCTVYIVQCKYPHYSSASFTMGCCSLTCPDFS